VFHQRTNGILARELGDEILVLDTETDQVHQLNATAGLVWRHCAEPSETLAIAVALTEQFDVTLEVAIDDVESTLRQLQQLHLVVEEPVDQNA
jgi:hypothetical protein